MPQGWLGVNPKLPPLKYVFDDMEEEEGRRYDLPKKRDLIFESFSDNDLKAHERALHSH